VKLVRAAFQGFVDNGSGVAAELWIERAGDDIYFRQRIGIHRDAGLVQQNIVDVRTVQQVGVLLRLASIGRESTLTVVCFYHPRRGLLQLDSIAAEGRQLLEFGGSDHMLKLHIGGLYLDGC
jgi:hypothetical protein